MDYVISIVYSPEKYQKNWEVLARRNRGFLFDLKLVHFRHARTSQFFDFCLNFSGLLTIDITSPYPLASGGM